MHMLCITYNYEKCKKIVASDIFIASDVSFWWTRRSSKSIWRTSETFNGTVWNENKMHSFQKNILPVEKLIFFRFKCLTCAKMTKNQKRTR